MAKIPQTPRLRADDLVDVPEEVSKALGQVMFSLNPFMQATHDALSQRINWKNFAAIKKTVSVNSKSFPLKVSIKGLPGKPDLVLIASLFDKTTKTSAIAPRLGWNYLGLQKDGPTIEMTVSDDLTEGHEYDMALLVTAE